MKILWFSWKDRKNPLSGGAELVNEELAKRLVKDGHKVIFLVGGYPGSCREGAVDGYRIIRVGNWLSVYWSAFWYYRRHLKNWPDLVIEEVNTVPFFAAFYSRKKSILFFHQLCRQIWFYQLSLLPATVGWLLEIVWLWLLRRKDVITVSESTKKDLLHFGFLSEKIKIISEGIEIAPVKNIVRIKKYPAPTILSLGIIRPTKRVEDVIAAFEIAKQKIENLELLIAGDAVGDYGSRILAAIRYSPYRDSIRYLGRVSRQEKIEILQKSHLLCVTAVKEGWGLTVTEAASQGTPAVGYNIDGLRDSIKNNRTGILCGKNTPQNLAENIAKLFHDREQYRQLQYHGWQLSREINFKKSYQEFLEILKKQ